MKGGDPLIPVVTLVLYFGEYRWTDSDCLFDDIPEYLQPFIDEHKIFLYEMKDVDYHVFGHKDIRDLVEGLQKIYALGDIQSLRHMNINKDVGLVLMSIVHNDELLEIMKQEKGDVINMCTSLDRLVEESKSIGRKEGRNEGMKVGITIGEERGIVIGEERGMERGMLQGKKDLLVTLLKSRIGLTKYDIVNQCTLEQLDLLTNHLFDIHNEDDLKHLLTCV